MAVKKKVKKAAKRAPARGTLCRSAAKPSASAGAPRKRLSAHSPPKPWTPKSPVGCGAWLVVKYSVRSVNKNDSTKEILPCHELEESLYRLLQVSRCRRPTTL